MIDESKYLYCLDRDDCDQLKETVWLEMYSRFGFVFHVVQMIEYNIANILAVEEFEKEAKEEYTQDDIERIRGLINDKYEQLSGMTFGQLKNEVKKSAYLQEIDFNSLQQIVDYRNWLAHHCFKELFHNSEKVPLEDVEAFREELEGFGSVVTTLNDWLVDIYKTQKVKRIYVK